MDGTWVPVRLRELRPEVVAGRRRVIVFGQYSSHDGIAVGTGQTKHDEINTFVHEVLHRCTDESGIRALLGKQLEETVVEALTPWVIAFIRENKGAVKYVQGPGY